MTKKYSKRKRSDSDIGSNNNSQDLERNMEEVNHKEIILVQSKNFQESNTAIHKQNVIEILSSDDDDEEKGDVDDVRHLLIREGDKVTGMNESSSSNSCTETYTIQQHKKLAEEEESSISSPVQKEKSQNYLSYQNSAYVQHFAEICHDILNDERWRTMDDKSRLFQWESGDDLSSIHAFSRLFIRMDTDNNNENEIGVDVKKQEQIFINPTSELNARCMNLYSRLFHRKGPWFNLSDIFIRYYHRDYIRRESYQNDFHCDHGEEGERTDNGNADLVRTEQQNPNKNVNWSWIEQRVFECFTDLQHLLSNGLIRSFKSELECGTIVGNYDSFCTMKEKESILRKLGGKPTTTSTISRASGKSFEENGKKSRRRKRKRVHRDNDILKHMQSQKTIFSHSNNILPVEKHVTNILLENFAQKLLHEVNKSVKLSKQEKKTSREIISMVKMIWKKVALDQKELL